MKTLHPEAANVLCLLPEVITKAKVKVSITFHLFSTKKGFLLVARNMVFRLFLLFLIYLCSWSNILSFGTGASKAHAMTYVASFSFQALPLVS